jgi:hypothetical protein
MLWNIAVNDAGADYDPLTLLRSRTMFGRPDWMSIYGRMRQAIEAGQYIPGSNAQLKSRVGVSAVIDLFSSEPTDNVSLFRLTSAVRVFWPRPSKRPPFITAAQMSTSRLPRFA